MPVIMPTPGNTTRGFEIVSEEQWEKDILETTDATVFCPYDEIILPYRKTARSAGYDLHSTADFLLRPGDEFLMPLGVKSYMQWDETLLILPRSSLGFKYVRLANSVGMIDSDFYNNPGTEGDIWVRLRNEGNKGSQPVGFKIGDAIGQAVFTKYLLADGDGFTTGIHGVYAERVGGIGSTDENPLEMPVAGKAVKRPPGVRRVHAKDMVSRRYYENHGIPFEVDEE